MIIRLTLTPGRHRAGLLYAMWEHGFPAAAGKGAFIVSPVLVGTLADATGLWLALALLVLTTLTAAALGLRWPDAHSAPPTDQRPPSSGRQRSW